jgi:hypothetical protein
MKLWENREFLDYVDKKLASHLVIRGYVRGNGELFGMWIYCRLALSGPMPAGYKNLLGYLFLEWGQECAGAGMPVVKLSVLYDRGLLPHLVSDMEFRYTAPPSWAAKKLNVIEAEGASSQGGQANSALLEKRYLHDMVAFARGVVFATLGTRRFPRRDRSELNLEEIDWLQLVYHRLGGAMRR